MFDARSAKALAQGQHLTIEGAPGLRLEASKTTRAWVYRYKSPVDGRMRQIKLGLWPQMTWQSAWAEWEVLRAARDAGRDPAAEKRAKRAQVVQDQAAAIEVQRQRSYTVAAVCSDYVDQLKARRSEKSWREVERRFARLLGDTATMPAARVGRREAFALISGHLDKPVEAKYLKQELAAAWDHAIDAGQLSEDVPNWWRQVLRGKIRSKGKQIQGEHVGAGKRALSEAELAKLIPWLANFSRNIEEVLTMYLWTGCRGAEICAMEAKEVAEEADGWWWTIPKAKTKNSWREEATDHRVPLVGRALSIVRRRLAVNPNGYLFPGFSKTPYLRQNSVQQRVYYHQPYCHSRPEELRPRLPVAHWAPHDLRRTVRTLLASMGCPADVAESVLGHQLKDVEGIYNLHKYDKERRDWLTRLDQRLEELAAEAK